MIVVLSSCSTSNSVVDGGIIQKRKYRSGYQIDIAHRQSKKIAPANEIGQPAESDETDRGDLSNAESLADSKASERKVESRTSEGIESSKENNEEQSKLE
jgi:hypothetical protein